ncbi:MAG: hypothetical protein GF331_06105 [Chitinivibrionales bacterium]|nr:hypothetical protein [Chitinivibrionales bacterium]
MLCRTRTCVSFSENTKPHREQTMSTPKKTFLCKSHPDFHIPGDVDVGAGFDGDAYARRLKENGADAVVFFAKCHYGHSYYYTDVGYRHPRLKSDMLAEVVKGCRTHGVGAIAYFSVFLDTMAIEHHPDWGLQATDNKVDAGFDSGNYLPVCVNSPYLEELFIPQSIEVVERYDLDEVFYDTMTGFKPCFCDNCKRLFGHPIPRSSEDPRWLQYVAWYRERYDAFFARTAEAVHEVKPDIGIAFNWEWGVRKPIDPPPHITRLSADLIATGTIASSLTHYYAGTGYPFDYMVGRFLHGLGDWNNTTPETLKYTASATIANGGSFYIIDRQLPNGDLEERGHAMMKEIFGFVQQRRDVVAGTAHVPEIAVLHSHDHLMGDRLQHFPEPDVRKQRTEPFEGVSRMFMHHARHYTALSTQTLARRRGEYGLVILPETEYIGADTLQTLTKYVEDGGSLLITQSPAQTGVNRDLLDLAGVRHEGVSQLDYCYFGDGPEPVSASGHCSFVKPVDGASEIVQLVSPLKAGKGGAKFGHGKAPADRYEGYAAATERTVGKGTVIYVAIPLFGEYWRRQNPYMADLAFSLIDRLLPRPLVRVDTRAQIEMVAVRKGDDLIVHLVNHSGRERLLGYWYPLTEYMPAIRDIPMAIRIDDKKPSMHRAPSGAELTYTVDDGYAKLTLDELEFMESVVVEGYFA